MSNSKAACVNSKLAVLQLTCDLLDKLLAFYRKALGAPTMRPQLLAPRVVVASGGQQLALDGELDVIQHPRAKRDFGGISIIFSTTFIPAPSARLRTSVRSGWGALRNVSRTRRCSLPQRSGIGSQVQILLPRPISKIVSAASNSAFGPGKTFFGPVLSQFVVRMTVLDPAQRTRPSRASRTSNDDARSSLPRSRRPCFI